MTSNKLLTYRRCQMNKNKIKWLYKKDKNRYYWFCWCYWKSLEENLEEMDKEIHPNFPCNRHKRGFKKIQQFNDICKEFGVKGYSNEYYRELDPWNDDNAMAWNEKKSWKRNSKRKHQWKES